MSIARKRLEKTWQPQREEHTFLLGLNYFRIKHLSIITKDFLLSQNILKQIENLTLKNAWIILWQQDKHKIHTNIVSFNKNFWQENQKNGKSSSRKILYFLI